MTGRAGRAGIEAAVRAQAAAEVMAERERYPGDGGAHRKVRRALERAARRITNPQPKES